MARFQTAKKVKTAVRNAGILAKRKVRELARRTPRTNLGIRDRQPQSPFQRHFFPAVRWEHIKIPGEGTMDTPHSVLAERGFVGSEKFLTPRERKLVSSLLQIREEGLLGEPYIHQSDDPKRPDIAIKFDYLNMPGHPEHHQALIVPKETQAYDLLLKIVQRKPKQ